MYTKIGTPYYIAPEVIEGSYDCMCDLWSTGVIAYCLLAGYPPFVEDSEILLFRKIMLCDFQFETKKWKTLSKEAQSFVKGLIEPNRERRMKPIEALRHPWI